MIAAKKAVYSLILALALILMTACGGVTASQTEEPTEAAEETEEAIGVIVIGDIGEDPAEIIEGAQPLADYLAARLVDYGIGRGEVRVAASAEEMAQLLESGEVDIYFDSMYPAMLVGDASGAQPFIRRWRRGVGEYHTIIFASRSSGVETLDDLPGHMVALDNNLSTSGYLMPMVAMIEAGLNPVEKSAAGDSVGADEVGYVFSFDDENTLAWVLADQVAAGATDNVHYAEFPQEARDQMVILAETESVPRQVGLASPTLDDDLLAAIIDILVAADEDEEGQAALETFSGTAQFDEFPQGIEAALERMRELLEIIQTYEAGS